MEAISPGPEDEDQALTLPPASHTDAGGLFMEDTMKKKQLSFKDRKKFGRKKMGPGNVMRPNAPDDTILHAKVARRGAYVRQK